MLKKLKELLRRDPEQFRIPRSVQEVIPIRTVWKAVSSLWGRTGTAAHGSSLTSTMRWPVRRTRNPCCWGTAAF